MKNDLSPVDQVVKQGQLIAEAIRAGELKVYIPSTLGEKAIEELSFDDHAVDYIVMSPEE